jgi:8-oxo-dGTP pyrophosphatase MutT (NUDIX family)
VDNRSLQLNFLSTYKGVDSDEEETRLKLIQFVKNNPDCFENAFVLGHVTGSALVVDRGFEHTLLTHHSVIDKWFQFGGHSDGHNNPLEVALREAKEESGLKSLQSVPGHEGIFDVDIHSISAKGEMPTHNHFDVRILLTADMSEPYTVSNESKDLKWIRLEEVEKYNQQPAFLRLVKKAVALRKLCSNRLGGNTIADSHGERI